MRARRVSLAFVYALAGIAAAAVALAPLPKSAGLLVAGACVAGALWDRCERHRTPGAVLTAAGVAGFVANLLPLQRETLAEQSLTALAILLAVKLLGQKRRRDHLQILAVSLVLVAGSASLEPEVGFALLLLLAVLLGVLFLLWLPFSEVVLAVDRRLATRLGVIGAALVALSLPVSVLLFLLLPRAVNPFWSGLGARPREGVSGVSEQLRLGDIGRVALSSAVAFRAEVEGGVPLARTPYWRGAVLEQTDGRRWSVSGLARPSSVVPSDAGAARITYYVEPHGDRQLFLLDTPIRASVGARTQLLGAARVLRLPLPLARRIRYSGSSVPSARYAERLSREEQELNLAVPAALPEAVRALAREVAGPAGDPRTISRRLTQHFSRGYTYSLQVPDAPGDPLEAFLLRHRTGYCEYFAASLTLLLRLSGIPARVVSGYLGGEWVPSGAYYRVAQSSAHAWVEAYLDGHWERLDPTPSAGELGTTFASSRAQRPWLWLDTLRMRWNSWVVQYDAESQLALARSGAARVRGLRRPEWPAGRVAAAATAALALLWGAGRLGRRRAAGPLVRRLRRFNALAARRGCARESWEGPLDHASRLARSLPEAAGDTLRFGELAAACRYGGQPADAAALARLDELLARIKEAAAAAPR